MKRHRLARGSFLLLIVNYPFIIQLFIKRNTNHTNRQTTRKRIMFTIQRVNYSYFVCFENWCGSCSLLRIFNLLAAFSRRTDNGQALLIDKFLPNLDKMKQILVTLNCAQSYSLYEISSTFFALSHFRIMYMLICYCLLACVIIRSNL
jgi:hypothetical protein